MADNIKDLEDARDVLASAIAQSMVIYGVTPSVGRIYGILYFSKVPLSLDEIQVQVAMSKASVSNGLRELQETEMVTKVWKKGERKDHYIAEKDFLRNFHNYFAKKIRQERSLIMKAVEQTEPLIEEISKQTGNEETRENAKADLALIKNSKDYFEWTARLANAMESGEIYDFLPLKTKE